MCFPGKFFVHCLTGAFLGFLAWNFSARSLNSTL